MPLQLFPFCYRDSLTGRWVKARYKATREEIGARHAEWEIIGPAEPRAPIVGTFQPYRGGRHAASWRLYEPAPQINPHLDRSPTLDAAECSLTLLFLRRYVVYCARHQRFGQAEGAARLHREIVDARCAL